jgi:hypothetical protein
VTNPSDCGVKRRPSSAAEPSLAAVVAGPTTAFQVVGTGAAPNTLHPQETAKERVTGVPMLALSSTARTCSGTVPTPCWV